jgi:hypothetical protein
MATTQPLMARNSLQNQTKVSQIFIVLRILQLAHCRRVVNSSNPDGRIWLPAISDPPDFLNIYR